VFQATGELCDVFPIISDLVRSISTFFNVFSWFSMFYHLYHICCYINGLSMHLQHYNISNQCISNILRPSVTFIYLCTYWCFRCFDYFWLLIGFSDCDVVIASDSNPYGLLVIYDHFYTILTSPKSFLQIYTQHTCFTQNKIVSHC